MKYTPTKEDFAKLRKAWKRSRRLRPWPGWKRLDGPPGHGKSSVWEHADVGRIHIGGTFIDLSGVVHQPESVSNRRTFWTALKHQPRRIRAMMVWAQAVALPQPCSDLVANDRKLCYEHRKTCPKCAAPGTHCAQAVAILTAHWHGWNGLS